MSQHRLQPLSPDSPTKIVVGWDPPLRTFFAQVFSGDDGSDLILWTGTSFDEIPDPREVVDQVRPYAQVSDNLISMLADDAAREGVRHNRALEDLILSMLSGDTPLRADR